VLKQKIWARGVSYELQEIYGMDGGAASRSDAGSGPQNGGAQAAHDAGSGGDGDGNSAGGVAAQGVHGSAAAAAAAECVICMSAERDTTVLPCRHMCLCRECALALKTRSNTCPICRWVGWSVGSGGRGEG
jgi:E3 ubiquitin-protein ligase MGRN1